MVWATAVPVAAPKKLAITAMKSARCGERALVPMAGAIALAASLKPLTTPKPIARTMTRMRSEKESSGMLERYPFKDIGHILTPVGRALHVF